MWLEAGDRKLGGAFSSPKAFQQLPTHSPALSEFGDCSQPTEVLKSSTL
jgi:hypothetical protein